MPILERYREKRPPGGTPYARLWRLAALLCVVAVVMLLATLRYAGQPAQDEEASAAATGEETVEESPAPASDWEPLPPKEERELLSSIVDQVPLGVREHKRAYYYLINKVRRMSPEEMADRLDRTVEYSDYDLQPHIVRGATVEVTGLVMRLVKTDLDTEEAGLPAVWEGQMADRKNRVYSFVLTEPPRPPFRVGLRMGDGVWATLRGIFMQVIVYPNREDPPRDVATPLIIAKGLRPARVAPLERGPVTWPWIVAMGILAAGLAVWLCMGALSRPRAALPPRPRRG